MAQKTIRIWFADFWPEWNVEDFITPILSNEYSVILDKNKPDILFHSIFNRMQESPKYTCKKVLILAENWRPSQFSTNYSVSFDPYTGTNYRLPLWQMYCLLKPNFIQRLLDRKTVQDFERFCAFTVSNGSNHLRSTHFDILNKYKKVHAYGKVRTNTLELRKATEGVYWRDAKDNFFLEHPHKFMMAYENTSYPGYSTEKIMDAFLVGSLPIYWGDPKIEKDWNPKAFINVMKNSNWLDIVKKLDNDKSFWLDMYLEPVFTSEQQERHLDNINSFEQWLMDIVN